MKKKIFYLDYLRFLAILAVITIHVAGQRFFDIESSSFEWQVFNFFDAIARWAVPVFVMISGSLFLNKDIEIRRLLKKNVLRLAIAYIIWSLIYIGIAGSEAERLELLTGGVVHLWFLPMIIGLYIAIPIMKKIVADEKVLKYFLTISLIFVFTIDPILYLIRDFLGEGGGLFRQTLSNILGNMDLKIFMGFPFYFMLGYYLDKKKFNPKQTKILYIIGIGGFIFTILVNSLSALYLQNNSTTYLGSFNLNVLAESVFIFTLLKNKKSKAGRFYPLIEKLSKYTFGAYLVHLMVLNFLRYNLNFDTLTFSPILTVPLLILIVSIISFLISFILNQIPFLKKYLV